jgi:hypothetical protein
VRIPTEPLPQYRRRNETKAFAEEDRPEPVDSSAGIDAALSGTLAEREKPVREDGADARRLDRRAGEPGQMPPNVVDERRREERRKENLPVLLDTRLTRCRRKSSRKSAIDVAI